MNGENRSAAAAEGTLTLDHAGRQLAVHFPDSGNMRQRLTEVLEGKEYPLVLYGQYVPEVIVDVGANVGGSALFFALNYPAARVLCYEPSPTNAEFLRRNTATFPRVQTFAYGLSDRTEMLPLYVGRDQPMQNSIYESVETAGEHEMAEFRNASDEFAARGLERVSILKLDTEGCELPILTALRERLGDVDLLYLEYHCEDDRQRIDRLLSPLFVLTFARCVDVHRGTLAYMSRAMLGRYPHLDAIRIDSTRRP